MNKNIAVFDFCDTIYKGQSLNEFMKYYVKDKFLLKYFLNFIEFLYNKGILRSDVKKRLQLKIFTGISENKYELLCENFYSDIIKSNFNNSIIKKIREANNNGYHVVILSGGLFDYIRFICNDLPIDNIIANKMLFENNICVGGIDSPECLSIGKLTRFNESYSINRNDYFDSLFYTDHFSDSVLFPIFKRNIIVVKGNEIPLWAKSFEIIEVN